MRLDDLPTSNRVEDRRGIPGGRADLLAAPKATGLRTREGFAGVRYRASKTGKHRGALLDEMRHPFLEIF
jgi:hypothetical protein